MEDFKSRAIDIFGKCYWDRFWVKVDGAFGDENTCWLWKAGCVPDYNGGHGQFKLNRRMQFAHRLAWELLRGPIPEGLLVLHNCPTGDNPRCCNPNHLAVGTQKRNMRDAWDRKRKIYCHGPGDKSPNHKISDAEVSVICGLCQGLQPRTKETTRMYEKLGARYGVGVACIRSIANQRKRILGNAPANQ